MNTSVLATMEGAGLGHSECEGVNRHGFLSYKPETLGLKDVMAVRKSHPHNLPGRKKCSTWVLYH